MLAADFMEGMEVRVRSMAWVVWVRRQSAPRWRGSLMVGCYGLYRSG